MSIEVSTPISVGELLDKLSVLRIKKHNFKNDSLQNVQQEYNHLARLWQDIHVKIQQPALDELYKLYDRICGINQVLWDLNHQIRECEKEGKFDQDFIDTSRRIYMNQDLRTSIRQQINIKADSVLQEECSFNKGTCDGKKTSRF